MIYKVSFEGTEVPIEEITDANWPIWEKGNRVPLIVNGHSVASRILS